MFESVKRLFAADPEVTKSLPTTDTAWSDTESFSGVNFPKYNPDSLRAWKGYKIYSDMMRDEQVKAVVRFRRDSITGRKWFFSFDSDVAEKLGEEEAARRIALFNHIVKSMQGTFSTRLNGIMSAMTHGFSLTDKVYQQIEWEGKTWYGIKRLRSKPYHTFEFYVDEYGNLDRIEQRTSGAYIQIDPKHMIMYVQNPDVDEQFGESELNAAYRSWYAKNIIIKFQSIYLERYAGGFVITQPKTGSGKSIRRGTQEYGELVSVLKSLQTKTAVFLPEWLDFEHYQPAATDAFEKAIAQHDKAIAKALLVPNLLGISEQGSTGSFAQSQTQLEAFLWMLEADAGRLEECLNEQLFMELGDANFGDGLYPQFRFRELSQAMITQILTTWNQLAQSGAVERTDADEDYVRDLLGFPSKPENEDEESESVKPDTALAGSQVDSLVKIAEEVAKGNLSPETAIEIIVSTFPIGREKAEAIVNGQEGIEIAPEPNPLDPNAEMPDGEEGEDEETEDTGDEETITGNKGLVAVQAHAHHSHKKAYPAFSRALRRVDFAAIDLAQQTIQWQGEDRLGAALDNVFENAEEAIIEKSLAEGTPDEYSPAPSDVKAIKKALEYTMRSGWELGQTHAKREIMKAGFSRKGTFANIRDIAAEFINARAANSTKKIMSDLLAVVDNVIINSVKFGWDNERTIREMYIAAAKQGFISWDLVQRKVPDAFKDPVATARTAVAVRTLQSEAINEARKSFFEDPSLGGFVVAYEYSAILDGRTTDICTALETGADGGPHVHAVDSAFWDTYRPPNHYNCRSLLIPITQDDEWEETTTVVGASPMVGFSVEQNWLTIPKEEIKEPEPPIININFAEGAFRVPEPKQPKIDFKPTIQMPEPKDKGKRTKTIDVEIGGKRVQGTITENDDE